MDILENILRKIYILIILVLLDKLMVFDAFSIFFVWCGECFQIVSITIDFVSEIVLTVSYMFLNFFYRDSIYMLRNTLRDTSSNALIMLIIITIEGSLTSIQLAICRNIQNYNWQVKPPCHLLRSV